MLVEKCHFSDAVYICPVYNSSNKCDICQGFCWDVFFSCYHVALIYFIFLIQYRLRYLVTCPKSPSCFYSTCCHWHVISIFHSAVHWPAPDIVQGHRMKLIWSWTVGQNWGNNRPGSEWDNLASSNNYVKKKTICVIVVSSIALFSASHHFTLID